MTSLFGQIEGTGFEVIDKSFIKAFIGHARVERLWSGARWLEGPCYFPAHGSLVFSDIPNNRIMRYNELDGSVGVFRAPANNANGHFRDREGRLVSCEHLTRRITRTEHDGTITVLASHYNGKRFNSPNDVVVKSDGSIWFTDPDFGILTDYEGVKQPHEQELCGVYRIDGLNGEVTRVIDDIVKPNGLAFSPDETELYVVECGTVPRKIIRYSVVGNGVTNPDVFCAYPGNHYDGFRFDKEGRIWTSSRDGVHCVNKQGETIGKILIPEYVSNVCFGGAHRNRMFICGTTSLYSAYLVANGVN
jgi:gluconolactonase